jgi:prepilin-type N-terminal cleavage/methylation domain-containing protein
MLLYNARKSNSGFTLIEMLVVVIIIGVIAAIAAPNFLGLLNRNRVNEAAQQVEGALKEAQRQAMRKGTQCTINIDKTNKTISGANCLLSTRVLNDLIILDSSRTSITFSGKGNIDATTTPVLVVSMTNGTNLQKCVVLEGFLASMRTGNYSGTIPTSPASASCVNTP